MAQNVTDDLEVGPSIDLSSGVTVTERVSSNDGRGNPSLTGILLDAMTDGSTREGGMWNFRGQEDPSCLSERGTFRLQVTRQCPGDRRQQRQFDPHPCFWSADS